MSKKILVVHHNDDDGICSAGLIAYYTGGRRNVECQQVTYDKNLKDIIKRVDDFDKIFFVDYSISTEENAKFILDLYKNSKKLVYWFDHHKSSIDFIDHNLRFKELENIPGYRIQGIAACGLVWLFYNYDKIVDRALLTYVLDFHNSHKKVSENMARLVLKEAPNLIQYIHRYDIWDLFEQIETNHFHYGWDVQDPMDYIAYLNLDNDTELVKDTIKKGKCIESYLNSDNGNHCRDNGFEITIRYEKNGIIKDYSCLALNTYHFSSLAFGSNIGIYDIVMPFFFTGKKWRHSMYTTKDDIDVSELCSILGGGGHSKAAGYVSDQLDIYPDTIIFIYK